MTPSKQPNSIREIHRLSELQQRILRVVCENENAGYSLIENETKHDRIVILRSVRSLEKNKMIKRSKKEPENPRSKLLFRPTPKGAFLAILYLNVPYEKCFSIYYKDKLSELISYFKDEEVRRNIVLGQIRDNVETNNFDNEGKQKPLRPKQEARILFDTLMKIPNVSVRELNNQYGQQMMLAAKRFYEDTDKNIHRILNEFKEIGY
jgi:predicted transcriptional regulator